MTEIHHVDPKRLKPHPSNPRFIRDENFSKLKQSIVDFPDMMEKRPLVANTQGEVLGGNMRLRAVMELGWKTVPVIEVDWEEAKQREFIIKDNSGFGEWDWDMIANEWTDEPLEEWGLDVPLWEEGGEGGGGSTSNGKLAELFGVPPFSVFDTRQGYWQERKRQWLSLGIKSELGRGGGLLMEAEQVTSPGLNYYRDMNRAKTTGGGGNQPSAQSRRTRKA